MKKNLLLILTIALFSFNRISAQSYIMQAASSGQTHVTCQGFIQNTLCNYGSFTAYCQNIDRWEAFTNNGTGPIRINLTSLALNTGDQVRVYNGVGTGGALLATYINTVTSVGNYVTAASGTITVRFTTNNDGLVGDGFTAIIGCQPTGCGGNNPAGDTCSTATRICDVSPYCGNTGGWYTADHENIDITGSSIFCGSIENNSWIVFTANTTSASFKVDVANCADPASGIQMQMYATNCTTYTAVSSCINQNTAPTTFTLNSSVALTPGTDYHLMIDGFAGNYCNYTVTPLVGAQVATLSISSNTLCSGQTNTLTLSGVTSGSSYTWTASSAGAISGSTTNSFVVVTPTTNTTYSVTVNQPNGCSVDTYTRSIVVNPVPSMTSANTTTVCSGTPLNFGLSSSLPSTFSWIAADNTNTSGESTSAVASGTINNTITNTTSVTQSVIYSVTPTSTLGSCAGAAQIVTVSVNPLPSPTITSTSTLCLGSSLTFTGTGASTYTWTTGGTGGLSASTGSTVSATPTATGNINYTVNVTSAAGCTNTAVKTITVNPNPVANAGSGGVLTCNTTSLGLSGSGGSSYAWTGPGIVSGAATATPSVNLPGTYSLIVTSSLSCNSPIATVAVTQNTVAPSVTSSVSAVLNCTLTSVNIVATTAASPVSYTWTGTGITAGSGSSSGTVNQPGTFNYTVTNTSTGCKTTGSQVVTQNTVAPTVTVSATQTITCAVPTVTITGSATPSTCTPVWSGGVTTGATSYTATASAANDYTLTATNPANGCTNSAVVQVVPDLGFPNLSTPAISNSITCTLNTASVVVTTTSTPVSYAWTGTGITSSTTTNSIAVNTGGTYTLVVRNTFSGCTSTVTAFVPTNTTLPVPSASNSTTLTCATTTAALTGGPASGVTYQWSGPGFSGGTTSQNAIASAPGTYTLKVTSSVNSCTAAATTSVSQNITPPSPTASNTTTLTCTTGTAALIGGPAAGVTYQWSGAGLSGGTTSQNAVAGAPGNYTLVVTSSANSCTAAATTSVTQNITPPSPTATNTTTLTCTTGTAALTGGPASGVTYQWSGAGFSGGTTSQNAVANAPGTYTLVVTSTVNSCTASATAAVTQNTTAPIPSASNSTTLTCSTTTAALTGGPASGVTYQWNGAGFSGGTTSQNAVANAPGTYTLVITSSVNSCTASATTTVTQNTTAPSPVANNGNILTCSTLTTALTGAPTTGVAYQWSGPGISGGTTSQNAVANAPGTYTLKVTDAVNSCTAIATTVVSQDIVAPVPFALNSTTLTCSVLTATLTGGPLAGGFTYQWSGPSFSGLTNTNQAFGTAPGTYSILVTNIANNCYATATVAVTQNTVAPSVAAANSGSLNCTVLNVNASATTTTTPVSYNWSGTGITSAANISTITVNQPGTFSYTVTNSTNDCETTGTVSVIQNTTAPTVTMPTTQTITCATPTVSLIGSANPSTCTPVWTGGVSSGANSYTATASSATIYTLTVTNPFNNCTNSGTVQVSPSAGFPSVTSSMTNSITCSMTSAQVVASTTTTPVSYSWSGPGSITGVTSSTATVSAGGTYTCVVTNTLSACSSTTTIFVPTNTTAVTASIAPTSSINCLITSQVLNASPTGSYSYSWTPNAGLTGTSVSTPTVSTGGTYSVVITNTVNGCVGSASIAVVSNTVIPTVTISPNSFTTTCATPTVQLTANTSTNSVSYNWTVPATGTLTSNSTSNPIANGAGVFTVVVTNTVNGCVSSPSTSSITINVVVPTATLSTNSLFITCTNPTPGTSVTTSTSTVSYSWTPSVGIASGATTANPTFTAAGTYSAIVTNTVNGCISNASANTVTVTLNNTIPTITISPSQTLTCTTPSVVVSTTVNPNTGVVYTWNGNGVTGATTNTVDVNQQGVYSTTVTNPVNGCSVTANVSITSNTVSPVAMIAVNSITTTCSSPTATLNATSSPSTGVSYNWTAPASGSLNTFTVSNPVAGGSGIFTVTITDNTNGCSTAVSQATVEIIPDAATPVVNVSANNLTITCTNTTVTTALTSTNTISSYNWNPSPVTGGANPVFNTPGVYTATVTASNGCPTNVSVNVDIDITVPTVTLTSATNDGTLTCLTTSITITPTVSPSSNLTYTWSPSVGIASNINQASATFTAAGIYTLAVTNTVTGCVTSLTNTANTFSVTEDNLAPTFTLGTAPSVTTTCAAPNATLSGTSNADPNSVYTWTTPTSATVTGNPIVNSTPGTYSVIVTNTVNGCSTSASAQPTVEVVADSGIPNVTLSANSLSITCSNPTPSVSITTTASPVSYSWSPISGIVPGTETTATPSFTAAGSYSVIVTNTVSGCATTIASNVVDVTLDNAIPSVTLSAAGNTGTITCVNPSVPISPIVTPTANLTYTWLPSGVTSTSINDATFTAAGVYTLVITNTLTGCVSSATNTANIYTVTSDTINPTAAINVVSSNTIIGCGASNGTVSIGSNNSTSPNSPVYSWLPGPTSGAILDVTAAGTYTLVVIDGINGCSDSTQITVLGNTIPPQNINAGTAVTIACGSSSVALNGVSTSTNVSYSWSGPSATSIISGSNTTTPTVGETGDYTLTVTDNLTGCQSTATVNVSQANVTAAFSADPTSGISPLTVNFTDASTGANTWTWNFGDASPSQTYTTNPSSLSNVYTTGSYTVTLTASSGSCTSTATLVIVVEDGLTIEIPNVFTPNGDKANDIFTINSTGVKEISLQIFNRWGEKLYEFSGPQASWDGLAPNGAKVPEGTYFFFVKATGFDGTEIEKNGTLNLFR